MLPRTEFKQNGSRRAEEDLGVDESDIKYAYVYDAHRRATFKQDQTERQGFESHY